MAAIHRALDECSAGHPVFYEDEEDIHLNPKTGADWQLRGQQKRVGTPEQNEKYYLAGALHCGTVMAGTSRHNNAQSSVLLNVATVEKSPPFYGNRQPVPRRSTWDGKSIAVFGAAI